MTAVREADIKTRKRTFQKLKIIARSGKRCSSMFEMNLVTFASFRIVYQAQGGHTSISEAALRANHASSDKLATSVRRPDTHA